MEKTVSAKAIWKGGMQFSAQSGQHTITVDQPAQMGGNDEGANPLAVQLFALGSCLGMVAAIIARQEQLDLKGFSAELEGDYDMDFVMGQPTDNPGGFLEIRVTAAIDAAMTDEEKQAFLEKVHSRCPVTNSLIKPTSLKIELG
jgi:uncharacterized OsmC-like protein